VRGPVEKTVQRAFSFFYEKTFKEHSQFWDNVITRHAEGLFLEGEKPSFCTFPTGLSGGQCSLSEKGSFETI
jgi:hypothetical protein